MSNNFIYNFIREYQLDIMLIMAGICTIQTVYALLSKAINKRRKIALVLFSLGAAILLYSDRLCYIYRGDTSATGFYMVRICNFLVFFMSLFTLHAFNMYLSALYLENDKMKRVPTRLFINSYLFGLGSLMLIISQFTGLYYTFNENNEYVRSNAYILSLIFPLLMIVIQLSVIIQYKKFVSRIAFISMILFAVMPLLASLLQIFAYGISLNNLAMVGMVVVVYIMSIFDVNQSVEQAEKLELDFLKQEQKKMHLLFEQTAESLVAAIDAKDRYTHGHSSRVADYSLKIAKLTGYDEEKCEQVYFAALLHDVGKIGISDAIINKEGKLTDSEYAEIKKHTIFGEQILSGITESPYLSIGAHYHHERFDGKGYPEGLKGEEIPEIARIIAVADAYDAMTSKRSYRDPIPQQKVREEFVKGTGFQFDPQFSRIMLHMIDLDSEYEMKERQEVKELSDNDTLVCEDYKTKISDGALINENPVTISFHSKTSKKHPLEDCVPSIILFDSLDAKTHESDTIAEDMTYFVYDEIRLDGLIKEKGSRKTAFSEEFNQEYKDKKWVFENITGLDYKIDAVKYKDHLQLKIDNSFKKITITIALPDSSRFAYLALTGKHCTISDVKIAKSDVSIDESYIPRIAEEVSYLSGPVGDIPNIQINSWRSNSSAGIPIIDSLFISYHSMSLPTARLIWHCPFFILYTSADGKIQGPGYKEFAFIRVDGECWDEEKIVKNKTEIKMNPDFLNWNEWKHRQKVGVDCSLSVKRKGNVIVFEGENCGISIKNTTTLLADVDDVYLALSGDQCVISNIKISK